MFPVDMHDCILTLDVTTLRLALLWEKLQIPDIILQNMEVFKDLVERSIFQQYMT